MDSKGPFLSECQAVLSICFVWGGGKDFRDMDKICTFLSIPQKGKRWLSQLYGQTKHDSHTVNITRLRHMFLGEASCATLLAHYLGQQGRQYVTLEKSPFLPGIQTFGSAPDVRKVVVKKKKKKKQRKCSYWLVTFIYRQGQDTGFCSPRSNSEHTTSRAGCESNGCYYHGMSCFY